MSRRVIVAVTVTDDDMDVNDIADYIASAHDAISWEHSLSDPTAWEWDGFWKDVRDGRIGPDGDKSAMHPTVTDLLAQIARDDDDRIVEWEEEK